LSWIQQFIAYVEAAGPANTLCEALLTISLHLFPTITAEGQLEILQHRAIEMEEDLDLEELIRYEDVLDLFAADDRTALEHEIEASKKKRTANQEFIGDYYKHRVRHTFLIICRGINPSHIYVPWGGLVEMFKLMYW